MAPQAEGVGVEINLKGKKLLQTINEHRQMDIGVYCESFRVNTVSMTDISIIMR